MSEQEKNINYSSEDIHQYLSGKLSPAQMHAMEKAALNDPLLADAMDGYNELSEFNTEKGFVQTQSDLAELRQKIDAGTTVPINKFKWWRVAAAAIFIGATIAFAFYKFNDNKKEPVVVAKNESKQQTIEPSQPNPIILDTVKNMEAITVKPTLPNTENPTVRLNNNSASGENSASKYDFATSSDSLNAADEYAMNETKEERRQIKTPEPVAQSKRNNTAVEKENKDYDFNDKAGVVKNVAVKRFSGKIVDNNSNPVPYANIIIGSGRESKTDANGMFNLDLPDSVVQITAYSKYYNATTTNMSAGYLSTITLSPKRIVFKKLKEEEFLKKTYIKKSRSIITILDKNSAEPKEGWTAFEQHLVNLLSDSEYDDGKPVVGQTIIKFEINAANTPVNFTFEESINSDVDEAIENLIKNESLWQAVQNKSLPGTVRLKIIF